MRMGISHANCRAMLVEGYSEVCVVSVLCAATIATEIILDLTKALALGTKCALRTFRQRRVSEMGRDGTGVQNATFTQLSVLHDDCQMNPTAKLPRAEDRNRFRRRKDTSVDEIVPPYLQPVCPRDSI